MFHCDECHGQFAHKPDCSSRVNFTDDEIAAERMHYRVLAESYQGLIDGLKEAKARGNLTLTERQSREIISTLSRAKRSAVDGVELWTDH